MGKPSSDHNTPKCFKLKKRSYILVFSLLAVFAISMMVTLVSCNSSSVSSDKNQRETVKTTQTTLQNSEIIVYVTKSSEKYHRSGCQYLSQSKIPVSLERAVQQGYGRCSRCNPPRLTTSTYTRSSELSYFNELYDKIVKGRTQAITTQPTEPAKTSDNCFTLGSTQDEVKEIMGTPDQIHDYSYFTVWYYKTSTVTFNDNGKVEEWSDDGDLKVWLGDRKDGAASIWIGCTQDQVLDAMGTPSRIHGYSFFTVWYYGTSTITFDEDGKVSEWSNYGNLNLE